MMVHYGTYRFRENKFATSRTNISVQYLSNHKDWSKTVIRDLPPHLLMLCMVVIFLFLFGRQTLMGSLPFLVSCHSACYYYWYCKCCLVLWRNKRSLSLPLSLLSRASRSEGPIKSVFVVLLDLYATLVAVACPHQSAHIPSHHLKATL